MRYIRIFLLQMETVFQERGRAFIWFFMAILNPLILVLFWKGAAGNKAVVPGWNFTTIASYYFFLTIAFSLLVCHPEEDISRVDIKEGNLISYLTKPFSYFWRKFLQEIPYRLLQSLYGVIVCIIFFFFFGKQFFSITNNISILLLSILVIGLAFFISFTMRAIMGITAFWFVDSRSFFEAMYATEFALGGTLLPLIFLPQPIAQIAYILPFSYIIYFPIIIIQGKLPLERVPSVILGQIVWLGIFTLLYKFLWNKGIKKFSGVGQ